MKLRCLVAMVVEGKQRAFGEIFEASDPRLIDGLLDAKFAEPFADCREVSAPPGWMTRFRVSQ